MSPRKKPSWFGFSRVGLRGVGGYLDWIRLECISYSDIPTIDTLLAVVVPRSIRYGNRFDTRSCRIEDLKHRSRTRIAARLATMCPTILVCLPAATVARHFDSPASHFDKHLSFPANTVYAIMHVAYQITQYCCCFCRRVVQPLL